MEHLPDEAIIRKLKSPVLAENDTAIKFLYHSMYRKVTHFIRKNTGTEQDADDVFQDGLVALYKAARANRLNDINNIKAYFFSICRNLWLKTLKKSQRIAELAEEHYMISEEVTQVHTLLSKEQTSIIDSLMSSLGESCHRILIHYYYDRLKMKEIMKLMGFASEQVVKNKKSSCMKKLRNIIASRPELEELLK